MAEVEEKELMNSTRNNEEALDEEPFDPEECRITGSKKEPILDYYDIDVTGDFIGEYVIT